MRWGRRHAAEANQTRAWSRDARKREQHFLQKNERAPIAGISAPYAHLVVRTLSMLVLVAYLGGRGRVHRLRLCARVGWTSRVGPPLWVSVVLDGMHAPGLTDCLKNQSSRDLRF